MTTTQAPQVATDGNGSYGTRRSQARSTFTETKLGFKTSEFIVTMVFVVGVLLATYADQDSLTRSDGFRYAAIAVAAYVISRGLAKLGVREPYTDDDR